eukprot:s923_g14.t1
MGWDRAHLGKELAQQLAQFSGFSIRALHKLHDLFTTAVRRSPKGTSPSALLRASFLQVYSAEACADENSALLLMALASASNCLQQSEAFKWLATALSHAPLVSGRAARGSAELAVEVQRRLGPLRAGHLDRAMTMLYLERANNETEALQQLDSLGKLDSQTKTLNMAALRKFPIHPLIAEIIPKAAEALSREMAVQPLSRESCSLRDAWALATCGQHRANAEHLFSLLQCAKALSAHLLREGPQLAQQKDATGESAWSLSERFQEGRIPLGSLPHPALTVLQPLVLAVSQGLVASLEEVPWAAAPRTSEVLFRIRFALGLVDHLQSMLEATVLGTDDKSSRSQAQQRQAWSFLEPKALCMLQEIYGFLKGLPSTPWVASVESLISRLRTHLASSGSAWDPDASRLKAKLLPLTDSISAWGGLAPPLRHSSEFLLEQLVLSTALGRVQLDRPAAYTASVLASLLIQREVLGDETQEALEVLRRKQHSPEAEPKNSEETVEASAKRVQQLFLVLEAIHSLWPLASCSLPNFETFAADVGCYAAIVNKQLQRFEGSATGAAARMHFLQAAAEVMVLQWSTGGPAPHVESELSLQIPGCSGLNGERLSSIQRRSLLAMRHHLLSSLGCVFSEEIAGGHPALNFLLTPATLSRLRPSGQLDNTSPPAASLVLSSGFVCAWSLNLCAMVSSTSVQNFKLHRSLLQSLAGSCFDVTRARAGDAEDWPACCHFLAVQLHGLQLAAKDRGHAADGALVSAVDLVMMAGHELAKQGESLVKIALELEKLRVAFEGEINIQVAVEKTQGHSWPMPFQAILKSFGLPALLLLEQCCRGRKEMSDGDAAGACGCIWALSGLWRLQSGGGVLLPGGVDASETAAQLRSECLRRADNLDKEVTTRALEELVIDGHCSSSEAATSKALDEVELWRKEAEDLQQHCRLRPPLAPQTGQHSPAVSMLGSIQSVERLQVYLSAP